MDVNTLLLVGTAVVFGFYIQSIIGFSASIIAFPIMLIVMDITEAISLLSLFLLLFSVLTIHKHWKYIDKKTVLSLSISGIIGLLIGIYFLGQGNTNWIKKGLGMVIIVNVLYTYFKPSFFFSAKKWSVVFGFLGGCFSGAYNAGGPIFVSYIVNKFDSKLQIKATLVAILGVMNVVRVPSLLFGDFLNTNTFLTFLYIVPFFLLSLFLGEKTYEHMPKQIFQNILLVFLLLSGIVLVLK